jgi:hypothetical protein
MPKKTLKQKIAASERKSYIIVDPEVKASALTNKIKQKTNVSAQEDSMLREYFFKDFTKSLLLVALVFGVEFLLYFATMNNYLKFLKY